MTLVDDVIADVRKLTNGGANIVNGGDLDLHHCDADGSDDAVDGLAPDFHASPINVKVMVMVTAGERIFGAVLVTCYPRRLWVHSFLSRVSIVLLTRDIDIVILSVRLSVRDTLVLYENGLTYRHSFSTIR